MMVNRKKERLKAIKLKYVFFSYKCDCCENYYRKEKMYFVNLWGVNRCIVPKTFCQHCMKSKEDVLTKVDSYSGLFGIAFVDEF